MLLNFSPDHLDRHAERRGVRGGEGADLREPDGGRLGGAQRRRPGGARAWRAAARARPLLFSMTGVDRARASSSTATRSSGAPRRATSRWCRCRRSGCSAATWWPTCWRRRRWRRSPASTPAAMTRAVEGFTRARARARAGRPRSAACGSSTTRRRPTSRRRGARSRASTTGVVVILGGRFKGGDFARSARAAGRAGRRPSWRSARRGRSIREALGGRVAVHEAADMSRRRADRVRVGGARATPSCSRPRARASTCSATTRSAAGCSSRKCCGCRRNGTSRVSSEQSSVGWCGEEPAAGNAGCPGLRGWCLRPRSG